MCFACMCVACVCICQPREPRLDERETPLPIRTLYVCMYVHACVRVCVRVCVCVCVSCVFVCTRPLKLQFALHPTHHSTRLTSSGSPRTPTHSARVHVCMLFCTCTRACVFIYRVTCAKMSVWTSGLYTCMCVMCVCVYVCVISIQ